MSTNCLLGLCFIKHRCKVKILCVYLLLLHVRPVQPWSQLQVNDTLCDEQVPCSPQGLREQKLNCDGATRRIGEGWALLWSVIACPERHDITVVPGF